MSVRRFACLLLVVSGMLGAGGLARAAEVLATWQQAELLGRDWTQERLVLPVDGALHGQDGLELRGQDGELLAHQWTLTAAGAPGIAFMADLPKHGTATWQLLRAEGQGTASASPWQESRTATMLELRNGAIGVRLALDQATAAANGPLLGVQLTSGQWVGAGALTGGELTSYELRTVDAGEVFHHYQAAMRLADGTAWTVDFQLDRGQPVLRVEESISQDGEALWTLKLEPGWGPTHMLYRDPVNGGKLYNDLLGPPRQAPVFTAEPWLRWWDGMPRGNWLALYDGQAPKKAAGAGGAKPEAPLLEGDPGLQMGLEEKKPGGQLADRDLLLVGTYDAGVWRTTGRDRRITPPLQLRRDELGLQLPVTGPGRHWLIAVDQAGETLETAGQAYVTPACQEWLIKHGDVPLQLVAGYTLDWTADGEPTSYPRLFVSEADLVALRERAPALEKERKGLLRKEPRSFGLDDWAYVYLCTRDPEIGQKLKKWGLGHIQGAVNLYLTQSAFPTMNVDLVRHYMQVAVAVNVADLLLMPGLLSEDEARRVRGQIAFLGYTLARPEVISPGRGYAANPNMTSMTLAALGTLACLLPEHPDAPAWFAKAYREWEREVTNWSGPNGGWLEAPHYAVAALDPLLAMAIASRRSGFVEDDLALHPSMRRTALWLAKIIGPPDPRLGGNRSHQAIGNSYTGERSCIPAWFATLWKDEDPEFAAQMQWMWIAQGRPDFPAIGGFCASTAGAGRLLITPDLPATQPNWGSELFPASGAVFRAHFASEQEMYLYYIQGPHHHHYDYDEGAIVFWGKGKPLVTEFGYYGRAPVREHSVLDDGTKRQLGWEGKIQDFATTDAADYLLGKRWDWSRQILFVKDRDPLGPNYAVLRDHLAKPRPSTWRVWVPSDHDLEGNPSKQHEALPDKIVSEPVAALDGLHLEEEPPPPPLPPNPVRMIGRVGGDLGVYFLRPDGIAVSTERVTQRSGASGYKDTALTQNSVKVDLPAGESLAAVLYPLLPDDEAPRFETLLADRVMRLAAGDATDYVLIAEAAFDYELPAVGLQFRGVAGLVQVRSDGVTLTLPQGGLLVFGEHRIESDEPISQRFNAAGQPQ